MLNLFRRKPAEHLPKPSDILAGLFIQRLLMEDPKLSGLKEQRRTTLARTQHIEIEIAWGESLIVVKFHRSGEYEACLTKTHNRKRVVIDFSERSAKQLYKALKKYSQMLADREAAQLKKENELAACDLIQETINGTLQLTT